MKDVVIAGAARTAVGSFMGSLADVPAAKLGAVAVAEAVARSGIRKEEVEQVIMGCVLPAGVGQAPAVHLFNRAEPMKALKAPISIMPSMPILITPERSPNSPHNAPNTSGVAFTSASVSNPT